MTKAELVNEMAIATGFDKKTVGIIVESFMEGVKGQLAKGESVYLRGFGTFTLNTRKAKIARSISKNTSIAVPAHKIAYFKPASELAEAVR